MSKLDEHIKANREAVTDFILSKHELGLRDEVETLIAFKGQIHALELVKDLEDFLEIYDEEQLLDEEDI